MTTELMGAILSAFCCALFFFNALVAWEEGGASTSEASDSWRSHVRLQRLFSILYAFCSISFLVLAKYLADL